MYTRYVDVIKQQLDMEPESWFFKSHPDYRVILEHVSKEQAVAYMKLAAKIDKSCGGFMLWNAPAMKNNVTLEETFGSRINIVSSRPENPVTGPDNLEVYW